MPDALGSRDLVVFSFESKATAGLPTSVMLRLARQSWSFNLKMGLTGFLRLSNDTFVQQIEGPCDVVQPLAARILADNRHGSIEISAFRRLAARCHASWSTSGFDFAREPGAAGELHEAVPANVAFLQSRHSRRMVARSASAGGGAA